jgi:hypothetical protein
MRVQVITAISTARGILPIGKILEISEAALLKLSGKVEVIIRNEPSTQSPLHVVTTATAKESPPVRVCFCCKSTDFWESALNENHFVCRKCHPPAPGAQRL